MTTRTAAKLQRWLDLIHCLLSHRVPVTFETIEREVPGFQRGSKAARKRAFERDKDELRRLGVPVETEGFLGDNDAAYRLRPEAFYLPYLSVASEREKARPARADGYGTLEDLAFTADELAMVAEAAIRATQLGDACLAAEATSAIRKLAFDLPLDAARAGGDAAIVPPRAAPAPETIALLHTALRARKTVTVEYHSMTEGTTSQRLLEPYGLCFLSGHWYLVARDAERGALRNFRTSRISKAAMNRARPNTPDYEIPASFSLRDHAQVREAWQLGDGDGEQATVVFRPASGPARAAMGLGAEVYGNPEQRRFDVRRRDVFARWLLSLAGDATPVAPDALVAEYVAMARATQELYRSADDTAQALDGAFAE